MPLPNPDEPPAESGLEFFTTEELIAELKSRHGAAILAMWDPKTETREMLTTAYRGDLLRVYGLHQHLGVVLHRLDPTRPPVPPAAFGDVDDEESR